MLFIVHNVVLDIATRTCVWTEGKRRTYHLRMSADTTHTFDHTATLKGLLSRSTDSIPGSVPQIFLVEGLDITKVYQGTHKSEEELGQDARFLLRHPPTCSDGVQDPPKYIILVILDLRKGMTASRAGREVWEFDNGQGPFTSRGVAMEQMT